MPYSEDIGRMVYEKARQQAPDEYAEVYGPAEDGWYEVSLGDHLVHLVRIKADEESVDVLIRPQTRDVDGLPSQLRWSRETSCWGVDRPSAIDLIAGFIARACWNS